MNATIEKIVNLLFEDLAETEETIAIREEILQKLEQHPNDADLQHELRYLLTGTE